MKVALTTWENRISPVFDSAGMVLVVQVENGVVVGRNFKPLESASPFSRALTLSTLGVNVLICGAISLVFANMIEARGIQIVSFVTGDVDQVLDAYLGGFLHQPSFQMPGSGMKRRRRFRGGRG